MSTKSRVFIGSSKEARFVARAVQQELSEIAYVMVWDQDAFEIADSTIDGLLSRLGKSDFGVFVLAADDVAIVRGDAKPSVRDNVIFELGAFMGRLGKRRAFIVCPQGELRLPSDLLGIVTADRYDAEWAIREPRAALGPACTQIKETIRALSEESNGARNLNELVRDALEAICRAMSVPVTPHEATLRAFVFRKEADELVCRHFWDPNPSSEEIGRTRFPISAEVARRVIVVKCYVDDATMRSPETDTEGGEVEALPSSFHEGDVKADLRYVLAAPIRDATGKIWGVVDFDASNEKGTEILKYEYSKAVIFRLAEHLRSVLT